MLKAPQVVREFKFSVLDDGANYDPALEGEEILLQGVTDCCLIELDGLVILDFKSDRLRPGAERERAEYYRGQLDAYSRARCRVFLSCRCRSALCISLQRTPPSACKEGNTA